MVQSNPYQSPSDVGNSSYDSPYDIGAPRTRWRDKLRPTFGEVAFLVMLAVACLLSDWYGIWLTNAEKIYTFSLCIALVACAIAPLQQPNNRSKQAFAYIFGVGANVAVAMMICWRLMVTGHPPNPYIILSSVAAGMLATRIAGV